MKFRYAMQLNTAMFIDYYYFIKREDNEHNYKFKN